jgi:hypothetical protein
MGTGFQPEKAYNNALITRRSQVRILPPLLRKPPLARGISCLRSGVRVGEIGCGATFGATRRCPTEEVDVLGEAIQQSPAFGEAGAALEDRAVGQRGGNGPQDLGDPVVLLDERLAQVVSGGCCGDESRKVRMLVQSHLACQERALGSAASGPKSTGSAG